MGAGSRQLFKCRCDGIDVMRDAVNYMSELFSLFFLSSSFFNTNELIAQLGCTFSVRYWYYRSTFTGKQYIQ